MEIFQTQIIIIISTTLLFYFYLTFKKARSASTQSSGTVKMVGPFASSLKDLVKAISTKVNVDFITLIKIYVMSVGLNVLAFEVFKLGNYKLIFDQYTSFIILTLFTVIIKIDKLDEISIFKKTVQLISEAIFILLLTTQYFIWIKIFSVYYVNIVFFILFLIQFIFSYVVQSDYSQENIFKKVFDYQIKQCWIILMAMIFLGDFNFHSYNRILEFFIVSLFLLKFFNAIETTTGKIIFRQSVELYRRFFTISIIALALGSIIIGIFI